MLRKLAAGTSVALVAAGLAAAPAVASRLPNASDADIPGGHPGHPRACGDMAPSGQNGLDKATTPADGRTVRPGDMIEVTLRWDEDVIGSEVLERALDCVRVDGRPAPGLDLDQGQVPNQGYLTHRYRIPNGLAPGAAVCDQGFVFGPPAEVPQRLASNRVCFTVAPPASSPSPAPGRPGPAAPPVGRPVPGGPGGSSSGGPGGSSQPPSGGTPGGRGPSADTATEFTPNIAAPVPTGPAISSSPAEVAAPAGTDLASPGGPGEEAPPLLPLTGRPARPLAAAGGANLVAAGLAFIGGARRRRSRRTPTPPPTPSG